MGARARVLTCGLPGELVLTSWRKGITTRGGTRSLLSELSPQSSTEKKTFMQRRHGAVATALAALIALVAVTTAPSPALATSHKQKQAQKFWYIGHAGGSMVQALGTGIRSDLTAASGVEGNTLPASNSNKVTGLNVGSGLVKLGVVNTWAQAHAVGNNGVKIVTGGRTSDVSLLGGLIRADAVETVSSATKSSAGLASSSSTTFVGLTINGQRYPASVPKNTTVVVPGVAYIALNSSYRADVAGGTYIMGFGMQVTLLRPFKDVPATANVLLNPTQSIVTPAPPPNAAQIGGIGYGTAIKATVGPALDVDAGPSAIVATPPGGTGKDTVQNTTTDVNVPNVLKATAVKSWTWGVTKPKRAKVKMNNQLAGLDVLNGLIKADAITTQSTSRRRTGKPIDTTQSVQFLNLVVAGNAIPVNVAPNSAIDIADVGHLVLNQQVKKKWGGYVRALHLTLTTEKYGLPIGAQIEIGVAMTYITG